MWSGANYQDRSTRNFVLPKLSLFLFDFSLLKHFRDSAEAAIKSRQLDRNSFAIEATSNDRSFCKNIGPIAKLS